MDTRLRLRCTHRTSIRMIAILLLLTSTFSAATVVHVPFGTANPCERIEPVTPSKKWLCTADEDRALTAAHKPRSGVETLGFMQFYADQWATDEAEISQSCFRATFGELGNLTAITMPLHHRVHRSAAMINTTSKFQAMNCRYAQHGSLAQQRCWTKLMLHKVVAARSSPYDITVLTDGDVFANPRLDLSPDLQRMWASNTLQSLVKALGDSDLAFPPLLVDIHGNLLSDARVWESLADSHAMLPRDAANIPGGFVVFRKGAATDRFFACSEQLMRAANSATAANNTLNEQEAYRKFASSGLTRNMAVRILSPSFWCGGDQGRDVLNTSWPKQDALTPPCPFVHTRNVVPEAKRVCARWFRHFPSRSPRLSRIGTLQR